MGSIFDANSYIDAVAFVEQAGDPTTIATRWLLYAKSGGMYQKSPAGTALRLLTTADIPGSGAAPADATYITQTPNGTLTNEQALSLLSSGFMYVTTATGVVSSVGSTGSGSVVRDTSPTIVTPTIAKLANLTTNGFVKTSGGDGTLGVNTYYPTLIGSGNTAAVAAGLTRYNCLFSTSQITTESNARSRLWGAGTLRNLSVRTTTAQGAAGSLVITLYLNGSPTTITLTIAAGTAAGEFTDATHSVTVAAGDYISLQFVNNDASNSSAATGNWTLEYDIDVV